jgi:uncharacterized protein YkwD
VRRFIITLIAAASTTGFTVLQIPVASAASAKTKSAQADCRELAAKHPAPSSSRARKLRRICQQSVRDTQAKSRTTTRPGKSAAPRTTPRKTLTSALPSAPSATPVAAASPAATIAAVLASPCQNTELMPEAANIALVRGAVLCLINRERAENGESPLTTSPELEAAAEGHTEELIADDYFAHISPSGETPVDRIRDTGYIPSRSDGYVIGENLAWGTYGLATPQAIVSAWIASPGHLANILEKQYRETGVGIVPEVPSSLGEGEPGATYAQEFGVIIR